MSELLAPSHPLRRLFAGTVQHVFAVDVGMCDPEISEYLAEMLSSKLHRDDFFPFQDIYGNRLENLAELATDAQLPADTPPSERKRLVHRHIGDFTLFWAGLFPEGLRRLKHAGLGSRIDDYMEQGKRSYDIASRLTNAEDKPPAHLLHRLSEHFEFCVFGLNLCRKEWDALGEGELPA